MSSLDEKQIIEIFQSKFGNQKFVSEDVETFRIGKNFAVIKTDTLVESTDVPPKMNLADVARKSIVASVSDFAAKGAKPFYGIISISLPKNFSKSKITQLAKGFKSASREFGFKILGGDTNQAKELVITVTLFGMAGKITHRSGARLGDVIVVSGPFGLSAAGLKIILHGKNAKPKFKRQATSAVFHPMPRLRFGIRAAGLLSSAMDSSDGLSTCLVEMSSQSRKKFVLHGMPGAMGLKEFVESNNLDPIDLVFNGGEEYEIVATVSPNNLGKLRKIAEAQKINLIEIGRVQKGSGVFLQNGKNQIKITDGGWLHKF
ncbi:MAG: thiamine-phosphate kinase [Nitrososphaerota archaeon]